MAGMRDDLLVGLDPSEKLAYPKAAKVISRVQVKPGTTPINSTVSIPSTATWAGCWALSSGGSANQTVRQSSGSGGNLVFELFKVKGGTTLEVGAGLRDAATTITYEGVVRVRATPGLQGTGAYTTNHQDPFDGEVYGVDAPRDNARLCIGNVVKMGKYSRNMISDINVETCEGGASGNDYGDFDSLNIGGLGAIAIPESVRRAGPGGGGAYFGFRVVGGVTTTFNLNVEPGPGQALITFFTDDPKGRE